MHRLAESKLLAGFIYGDPHMQEYIYLPASELDAASPMLVYETGKSGATSTCRKPSPSSRNEASSSAATPSSGRIRWDDG